MITKGLRLRTPDWAGNQAEQTYAWEPAHRHASSTPGPAGHLWGNITGSNAHIVTVFDLGQEQDQPYMVTELMGCGDVEGMIEHAPDHRTPLEQTIKIAQETCRGMEFAHNRGIVQITLLCSREQPQ